MEWYGVLAHFFVAAFLTNAVPHFVQGVTGHRFPTPFSRPPGRGASAPIVNVVWALINVAIAVGLLHWVPIPDPWPVGSMVALSAGLIVTSLAVASFFGRWRGANGNG